jgi:hypothetical protein
MPQSGSQRRQTAVATIDPLLPFEMGPVNGREGRESGLWLKASIASNQPISFGLVGASSLDAEDHG